MGWMMGLEPTTTGINPGLYQLSYTHHSKTAVAKMARPAGFEPATYGLEGRCSIQLSYGRISKKVLKKYGRDREIRTPDILHPKQARYQTALYPDMLPNQREGE